MATILVLHGPNLNLLGEREQNVYGTTSLLAINKEMQNYAYEFGKKILIFQSNSESELTEKIHQSLSQDIKLILINPASLTHTSVVLRDALLAVDVPFVEVHMSNIYSREAFRSRSYFSDIALGVIAGFGADSYLLALKFAFKKIDL